MTDLVYPAYPAPILPARTFTTDESAQMQNEEMLPIVETSGAVIGQAARPYCHGGAKPLHPVVHLHIIDREGRIFLQKRSATKTLLPLYWDTAVGGHVSYGESVIEALQREAQEELGLLEFNPTFLRTHVYETEIEKELVFVFAAVGNFDLHPDNDEVEEGRFWTRKEIERATGKSKLTPMFEAEFKMFYNDLTALL